METKSAIINRFAAALERSSANEMDILRLIHFIQDAGEFLTELRGQADNGSMRAALQVHRLVLDHGKELEAPFTAMADTANSITILAGKHSEALNLINGMSAELDQVVDGFNA